MRTMISEVIEKIRRRVRLQNQSDEGADVLVVGIIVLPLIIGAVGFALDITKNIYLGNAYEAMAQQAVNAASNERNIYGDLVESSGDEFIREYAVQRGDGNSYDGGTQTRETQAFRSDTCNSATEEELSVDYDEMNGVDSISAFPRIELSYSSERGGGMSNQGPFITEGAIDENSSITLDGYNPSGNIIMEATVYDVSNNFLFAIFGNECQLYKSEVNSIPVLDDQDF